MIFIKVDNTGKETLRHNMPFDPVNGLGKTEEELLQEGYLFESLPEPEIINGKDAILMISSSGEPYYEYQDRKLTMEEVAEIISAQVISAKDEYLKLDLNTASLQEVQNAKIKLLSEDCKNDILNGFDYDLNGIVYHFSFDGEAQANFTGTVATLSAGIITTIPEWTVSENGIYKRIQMTVDEFKEVSRYALTIKDEKISKFRNTLVPQVMAATTNQEVDAVVW